ncbi:MAG TPA: phosphoenolpyruvate synthase [Puia sp.]|nr:phosphoenolpyruvate synthase [Puia sp.]
MTSYVLGFHDIDKTSGVAAGGKGANLGELCRIEGINVPDGFCITTDAFKAILRQSPLIAGLLDQLSALRPGKPEKIGELGALIRHAIETVPIPRRMEQEITHAIGTLGQNDAYAIRSSATAEDLPTASFAGLQDSYLNTIGLEAIFKRISQCWASLFTDRAVAYRMQNGYDHRDVRLAVVIQKMVFPQAAGVLFTADPVTGNRNVLSIDAGLGLGEALVSGIVNPDVYKVREGRITNKKLSSKKLAVYPQKDGGTRQSAIPPDRQESQALTDEQILRLGSIGRKIEAHFGRPQDIEWCLVGDVFYIVQTRPITTLYPIPERSDRADHVYLSVGHQQMMTDPMKPLGLSFFQLTAGRPMFAAGGRLFVDVTDNLTSTSGRQALLNIMGQHDTLLKDALLTIIQRDFIKTAPEDNDDAPAKSTKTSPLAAPPAPIENDPAIVADLIRVNRSSVQRLKEDIRTKSGADLFDFIKEDIQRLRKLMADPKSFATFMTAINASNWINEHMNVWLGEKNVADTLSQSVPNNITSEMGLALLEVADVIRPFPPVIDYLRQVKDDPSLGQLAAIEGGRKSLEAIHAFLDKFGMRCAGEIDITRTRWSERPAILVPMILGNIANLPRGAAGRKFEQGLKEATDKEQDLLHRLRQLPDGERKAAETERMIRLLRNFIGYREYPKYGIVSRYLVYKQAIVKEADRLLADGVIREKEDIYYLGFDELRELVRTNVPDYRIIDDRKAAFREFEKLHPPRVMTSEGEIITGAYRREALPEHALPGLAVSSGVAEGRARVVLHLQEARLSEDDILVTVFTDPSWTPLFVSIKGLVTEVGGLMTHGAVIAREYGLPAVVGVENATRLIKDGQRIRVHGTEGYVEIL